MELHLVVVRPFDNFVRGDVITDPVRVAAILSGERARYVVRVSVRNVKGD